MTDPRALLRDLIAENEGRRRNGPASDGRGWYRRAGDREDCYAVADAVMELLETVSFDDGPRVHIWTYPIDTLRPGYTEMRETPR